jgi:hypothetical protein
MSNGRFQDHSGLFLADLFGIEGGLSRDFGELPPLGKCEVVGVYAEPLHVCSRDVKIDLAAIGTHTGNLKGEATFDSVKVTLSPTWGIGVLARQAGFDGSSASAATSSASYNRPSNAPAFGCSTRVV